MVRSRRNRRIERLVPTIAAGEQNVLFQDFLDCFAPRGGRIDYLIPIFRIRLYFYCNRCLLGCGAFRFGGKVPVAFCQ